jgi:pyridoxal phosphate enzyme (YggS family)
MIEKEIADRLVRVQERINNACARVGRNPDEVTLIAVTKRISLDRVVAACRVGQWDFGENRIQEAIPRQPELAEKLVAAGLQPDQVRWHFIGHLQRNKARKAVGAFGLIQAVDSVRLAEALEARAAALQLRQGILLEVNMTGEPQKYGVEPGEALALALRTAELPHLELQGLMTMARFGAQEPELRRTFSGLRRLLEKARRQTHLPLPQLSMGMSDDFEAALLEGATMVRIGTAVFGPRSPL